MKQRLICKGLAVAVILLFLGLAIQPSVAVDTNIKDSKEECNICPKKISKSHLVLIRSLLNRLEKYDNQLSVLSKQYPEFEEKYQEVSNVITHLNVEVNKNREQICTILFVFGLWFFGWMAWFTTVAGIFPNRIIWVGFFELFSSICFMFLAIIVVIALLLNCEYYFYFP